MKKAASVKRIRQYTRNKQRDSISVFCFLCGWLVLHFVFACKPEGPIPKELIALKKHTKELDTLRVLEAENTERSLRLRIDLDLLRYQNRNLSVSMALHTPLEGGGYAFIEETTVAMLRPRYKLQSYKRYRIDIPYEKISVSYGVHHLFMDLRIRNERRETIAAVLNKDFRLRKPDPTAVAVGLTHAAVRAGELRVLRIGGVGFRLRAIPAGTFLMGSPSGEAGRFWDEGPQREVQLTRGYWMTETEITQKQYQAIVGVNPSTFLSCGGNCPVERVSWSDAARFANRLSEKQGLERCFSCSDAACVAVPDSYLQCKGWRLPTEAEWEYAARANSKGSHHGTLGAVAWFERNAEKKTHPVASKIPNAWGLYDMLGNVWEWCFDGYQGRYQDLPLVDPIGGSGAIDRVARGGSWNTKTEHLRFACRNNKSASAQPSPDLGFRLVRLDSGSR
jgi:formylglycine-generating enzyme required for sulfatase activity